jgi:hypothetical protein
MSRSVAPRSWGFRESLVHGPDGSYQAVCGHYLAAGTYACQDCNLAPLSEWLALRELVAELTDLLEGQPRLIKAEIVAINRAKKLLEELD